ncbi:MAG: OmpA family protein [Bacteroidota bacterium]
MRFLLLSCFLFQFITLSTAQNLVPNPSFERVNEITDRWMGTFSKFNRAMKFWNSPTQGSPDLLFLKVKDRMFPPRDGFDLTSYFPRTGKMMVGIKTYGCAEKVMHCKEYLQISLKQPLQIGMEYYLEFYVNPLYSSILNNNIGAAFSTNRTRQLYAEGLYDFEAKINTKEVITYTGEWQKVSGKFVADSAYQYLMIGNFYKDDRTNIEITNAEMDYGFILIDDVRFVRSDQEHLAFADELDLGSIQFEWDKSVLLDRAYPVLNEIVSILKTDETLKIKINGHTDDTGNLRYNQRLSDARAKRVFDYFVANGIAAHRLQYFGFGATQAIASNATEEGRKQNRRVEFEVEEN